MDRMLYLAMSAAKNTLQAQTLNSHNLANVNSSGFRADLARFASVPVTGTGMMTRTYAVEGPSGVDFRPGRMDYTGNDLDIAIAGDGWMAVQTPENGEAYTRAGDLQITATGLLENGAGYPVLGNAGPITIPPADKVEIAADGTITIRPTGQDAKTLSIIDRIKLVNPPQDNMVKGLDGQLHMQDGSVAPADASVRVASGTLEASNVNMVSALVDMIDLARQFEMNIKAIHTAEDDDQAAAQMLRP